MTSRKIGSLTVSATGLGCMNVSYGYGSADDAESARLLHEALDIGVDFLDTAFTYGVGHSETLIGKTLSGERQRFVLASKCGLSPEGIDGRPETIRRQCETSLQRLQTDVIDLYYLHRVDPAVPVEESVAAMAELDAADLRCTIARPRFEPDAFAINEQLLVSFSQIAQDNNCTMAQLALAWLLLQENQSMVPIPGTRNRQHMRDNALSVQVSLSAETLARLSETINESKVVGTRYTTERMADADSERDVV